MQIVMIVSRPSTDAYRAGWEHAFGSKYQPHTECFVCGSVRDGNLEKCPACGSDWLTKEFPNGVYVPDAY